MGKYWSLKNSTFYLHGFCETALCHVAHSTESLHEYTEICGWEKQRKEINRKKIGPSGSDQLVSNAHQPAFYSSNRLFCDHAICFLLLMRFFWKYLFGALNKASFQVKSYLILLIKNYKKMKKINNTQCTTNCRK